MYRRRGPLSPECLSDGLAPRACELPSSPAPPWRFVAAASFREANVEFKPLPPHLAAATPFRHRVGRVAPTNSEAPAAEARNASPPAYRVPRHSVHSPFPSGPQGSIRDPSPLSGVATAPLGFSHAFRGPNPYSATTSRSCRVRAPRPYSCLAAARGECHVLATEVPTRRPPSHV